MRVLLAIDGSRPADRAREVVGALDWPAGTHIRVVAALEHRTDLFGAPWIPTSPEPAAKFERQIVYTLDTSLDAAERDLARPDRKVERILLRGRPASAIVDEAKSFGADLVVVGSRGHGPFEAMLLGSVSAEIVDHAPCPVLVVREAPVTSLLLADDGSRSARNAAHVLEAWPIFRPLPVTVLGVAEVDVPMSPGLAAGLYDEVLASYTASVDEARQQSLARAEATAETLSAAGYEASAVVREGDPAHEIVDLARDRRTGLIVMGTRGHTGLARLVLGSVARNVLLHAPCSVLVVREKAAVRPVEGPAEEAPATR